MKPKLSLVQQRTANSAVAGSEEENDEAKFLADLRGLVWKSQGQDVRGWKGLAEKARLSDKTVARFASGETKKPHLFTIRRILVAIDYVLQAVPRSVAARRKK